MMKSQNRNQKNQVPFLKIFSDVPFHLEIIPQGAGGLGDMQEYRGRRRNMNYNLYTNTCTRLINSTNIHHIIIIPMPPADGAYSNLFY